MAYEQKDNSGALFKNDKRETDTHPHMKGSIMVAGIEYWISAWTNTSEKGVRYQSLSVQPKQQAHNDGIIPAREAASPSQHPQQPEGDFPEDDIPF